MFSQENALSGAKINFPMNTGANLAHHWSEWKYCASRKIASLLAPFCIDALRQCISRKIGSTSCGKVQNQSIWHIRQRDDTNCINIETSFVDIDVFYMCSWHCFKFASCCPSSLNIFARYDIVIMNYQIFIWNQIKLTLING